MQCFILTIGRMYSSRSSRSHKNQVAPRIYASLPFQLILHHSNHRNWGNISTVWGPWKKTRKSLHLWSNFPTPLIAPKPSGNHSRSSWKLSLRSRTCDSESGRTRQCPRWVCMSQPTHTALNLLQSWLPGSTSTFIPHSLRNCHKILKNSSTTMGQVSWTNKIK